ncbi:transmembrane amino acid transporter protein-domain-containing protein [Rhexocercosporidium sp. MPI-PUGE-AT-0058]|nr:transmembrane amino acid transporter protein-domain-containing protein [Rhexocercosporidium sp. MPI-PUGE-AT-0058]
MEKNQGQFALDNGHEPSIEKGFTIEAAQVHNDPSILFEEYLHYASITRAEEREYEGNMIKRKDPWSLGGIIKNRFSKGHVHEVNAVVADGTITTTHNNHTSVTDLEWRQASRATRTASWGIIFFLITTDILGPGGAPWAFSNTGYGPGVALYTVFGFMASVSGWYVWGVYMHTDSDRYPLRDFGQAFFRIYGSTARHIINVLQSLQMFMLVAVLILSLGGSVSQISIGKDGIHGNGLCFIVCLVIIAILGMVLGQIRTLQRFGWLANVAVFTTVVTCFIAIGVSANSTPNYATMLGSFGGAGTPFGDTNFPNGTVESAIGIKTFAGTPPDGYASGGTGFLGTYQGINTIIYSYGGAMLFFNLLAEMRNPWDFWKGMLCADIFIYLVYMFFGIFQYSYQGQYTYSSNIQSINPYNYQTAGNIMSLIGGLIAAALYGNIGIKVIYNNVFMEIFHFPALTTFKGKLIWVAMVPAYWAFAFVVAAAVPNLGDFSSLVGAFCIGNFTYSFPAILKIGFDIKRGAMLPDEVFDEASKKFVRHDEGMKRWIRGYKKTWMLTSFNIFYALGALVVCGMGCYAAIEALMSAFGSGGSSATAFSCTSPYAG